RRSIRVPITAFPTVGDGNCRRGSTRELMPFSHCTILLTYRSGRYQPEGEVVSRRQSISNFASLVHSVFPLRATVEIVRSRAKSCSSVGAPASAEIFIANQGRTESALLCRAPNSDSAMKLTGVVVLDSIDFQSAA